MKAVFVKGGVVVGVAQFTTGTISSSDPSTVVIYRDDNDSVSEGDLYSDGEFHPDPPAESAPVSVTLSPVQFKLLFTSPERVAIKAARATDPLIDDFYDIVDDPRLSHVDLSLASTKQGVEYMAQQGLIQPERVAQILAGVVQ